MIYSPVDLAISILYLVISLCVPVAALVTILIHKKNAREAITGELFAGVKLDKLGICAAYNAV